MFIMNNAKLFAEREATCKAMIRMAFPHREYRFARDDIRGAIATLRSIRAAQAAYDQGLHDGLNNVRQDFNSPVIL